jgi:hypothetical protein
MSQPLPAARSSEAPEATYLRRRAEFGAIRDRYERRSYRNANLSLALIGGALLCGGLWLWRGSPLLLAAAALLGLGFAISFIAHGRVDQTLRRYAELHAISAEGLLRLGRDWAALPLRQPIESQQARPQRRERSIYGQIFAPFTLTQQPPDPVPDQPASPAVAADLDLLGHASLQHLLCTPATQVGLATLRDWLVAPAAPGAARARQSAVAELAPLIDLRDQFALRGRLIGAAESDYARFATWATRPDWQRARGWLLAAARALPPITLLLALAQVLGLTSWPLWLVGLAVGLVLTQTVGRSVDRLIDEVAERQELFATYADLFGLLGAQRFDAPELRRLQAELTAGELSAEAQVRRLSRLMALADLRGWMFFYPIQLATLWNVHVLWLLERWRGVSGGRVAGWLAALGEFEALAALATLAHDQPGWVFPELLDSYVAPGTPVVEARALGHPLLPPAVCVGNDVAVGPPGRVLLVTGSNMSGKSTLLRAIGLNVVLAQAGGPVCAAGLRLRPAVLATSMRVQDSLEQGVSYFMAELRRLKEVVEVAEQAQAGGGRVALFLLDEILHGTNTSERQIAARRIILYLLGLGATGAVSTHDLALAAAPELAPVSDLVHFAEQFTRGADGLTMTFDYRLRPGVATSTNALKLMEMIGLPAEDAPVAPPRATAS